jgi:hypothetical protein
MEMHPEYAGVGNPYALAEVVAGRRIHWQKVSNPRGLFCNPWGTTEATVGRLKGTTRFYDVDRWRAVDLGVVDGVFGVDAETFRRHFNYLGGCTA